MNRVVAISRASGGDGYDAEIRTSDEHLCVA